MKTNTPLNPLSRIVPLRRSLQCVILLLWLGAVSTLTGADKSVPGPAESPARTKLKVSAPGVAETLSAQGGELIGDYGSYQLWSAPPGLATVLAAQAGVTVREDEDVIELYAGAIKTSAARKQPAVGPAEQFAGRRLHLIQFAGPIKPEWRATLVEQGWRIVTYVPQNAYLVYGDAAALGEFRSSTRSAVHVQWEGRYLPEHKVHPRAQAAAQKASRGEATDDLFAVQLVEDETANTQSLQFLNQVRRRIVRRTAFLGYVNVVLRLPPGRLAEVAAFPDVVSIQTYEEPRKRDERQGQILAGNLTAGVPNGPGYLSWLAGKGFTAAQFTASDFTVDVSDSGIDNGTQVPGHPGLYTLGNPALAGRVAYNRLLGTPNIGSTIQACDGHGNLNSHIVAGYNDLSGFPHTDSEGYHYGLGICPFVKVGSSVIFDPDTFTDPNYAELQSRAYQDGARISCNSWGGGGNGAYSIDSQAYDALVRDAQPGGSPFPTPGNQQMVIVFSAGNDGSGANTIGYPGTGKNIISVGAAENVHSHSTANGGNNTAGNDGCSIADTGANSANDIIFFSSRGPCDDGRVKPDIMGPGTHVTGGVGQQSSPGALGTALACFHAGGVCALPGGGFVGDPDNFFPLGQQFYTTSSGTSHSCPAVGGGAALLRQYFINRAWPAPSPAMTKAWLMNSSRYMTGLYANDTLPSNNQGMGMMNLGTAFDGVPRVRRDQLDEDRFTASSQTRIFEGYIADPAQPLRVTLAWTDAPGSTTGNAYNNNLDLTVTVGGQTYRGNVFSGGVSATGGSADLRNNVESVFLPAGVSGLFTITVTAANINSDGVPGNADPLDQDFALVIYNSSDRPVDLVPAGAAVTAENCTPSTGTIDPGETVTVEFAVQNIGPSNSVALVGTLLATNGVLAPSGPQNYGAVNGGGAVVSRPFTFTAAGTCGTTLNARLHLQDGTNDHGVLEFPLNLGHLATNTLPHTNPTALTISATTGAVSPYPSPITVSGAPGNISKVAVTLRGFSHTWPDDLDVLLVGPQGQAVMLLSDVGGGNDVTNLTLTLDDDAGANLPDDAALTDDAWRPTNFETDPPLPAPAPAGTYATALSVFAGTDPNGVWKLFVADDYPSDDGGEILGGWELAVVTTNLACCVDASSADLAVQGTDSPDPVAPFNTVAYTITVTNQGPALATSVSLVNTLSSGASFLWGNTSQGTLTHAAGVVTCNLGSLAPGTAATVNISVLAVAGPELVCSSVVAAAQPDPNPLNNQANVTTAVSVPALTIQDTSVIEGDSSGAVAVFLLTLSRPASQSVTVDYYTADGTATAGADYVGLAHRATFLPGEISKTIEVLVLGDTLNEDDETFRLILTNNVNATLARSAGVATILDDDPMPALSVADSAVVEGNSGATNAVFTVSLSAPSGRPISALFSTTNGTAVAGSDYAAVGAQTLRLLPGQTATNVAVTVYGDTEIEPNEVFFVGLSSPTNAVLDRSMGVGTILTDELSPLVSVVSYRIIAESQVPNGAVDAGETVTLSVALRNDGGADTTNLVVTLLPGNGVAGPSGPQTYGALTTGGPQISRPFTFTAAVANCDTLRAAFQLQDGTANFGTQTVSIVVGNCFVDDFEPDIDLSQWAGFGGTVLATNYGGYVSPTHSLWFGGDGSRYAMSRPINTSCGGIISFHLRLSGGGLSGQWEAVDLPGEGVVLEYSVNAGSTWVEMGRYTNVAYTNWTFISSDIPAPAQAPATQFRWRQLANSGSCCDHWALDDVLVNAATAPSITSHPASQAVLPGTSLSFCVSAIGCPPLSYQWRKDGTNLVEGGRFSRTTNSCLQITGAAEEDSGEYSVALTNAYGYAISSNAALLVSSLDHFAWSAIPSPQTAYVPFSATITAQDQLNNPVASFNGCASLSAVIAGKNVGTGTTPVAFPMNTAFHDQRTQVIYRSSDIGGAGRITALSLNVATPPGQTMNAWTIRLKHTSLTVYASYLWESTGWAVVYQGNPTVTTAGWVAFEFQTPFDYNGVDNLMIDFSFNNSSSSSSGLCRASTGPGFRTLYYTTQSSYGDPLTWSGGVPTPSASSFTPNLQLVMSSGLAVRVEPAAVCFTNGIWSGPVAVLAPATNLALRAVTMFGHSGQSTPFNVLPDALAVAPPDGLESSGYEGGPFSPAAKVYGLTNNGGTSLNWSASSAETWITVIPSEGSLAPGAGTNATVLINANAYALTNGTHTATVTFSNLTSGAPNLRGVELTAYKCIPPLIPTSPLPTNGATVVSVHTPLAWAGTAPTLVAVRQARPDESGAASAVVTSLGTETIRRLSFIRDGVELEQAVWIEEPVADSLATAASKQQLTNTLINFDDLTAPCYFSATVRLTNRYSSQGVTFAGPGGNDGGAILDQCGSFGVSGHSPPNFLAFNSGAPMSDGGIPRGPEALLFDPPVSEVSMLVGSDSFSGRVVTLQAFDAADVLVSSANVVLSPVLSPLTVSGARITRVVVSSTANIFVIDDVSFAPESGPGTMYDVYFGTNSGDLSLIASNLTETSLDPGPLDFNTTYYWQVVAHACGSATGGLWSFTTALDEVRFASITNSMGEADGVALISVVRENTNAGPFAVSFTTTNGTATAGLDYVATNGTFEFAAALTSTNFAVTVLEDNLSEPNETVLLRLNTASPNVLLGADATLIIVDDDAPRVSLFFDPAYVDTGTSTDGEATNVIAALKARGSVVQTFTGITPTAFSNALIGADILYIPELESGDLGAALSASAKSVISNFVAAGGGLIINGQGANRDEYFVNQVFGHSVTSGSGSGPTLLTAAAGGTAFAGGPPSLADNNATSGWLRSSLPVGSLSIYENSGASYTTVALIPKGAGKIVFLAYDWYDAVPRGTQDGGWDEVLWRAVLTSVTPANLLAVAPSDGWASYGYEGGPFNPSNQVYSLSNLGGSNLTWSAGWTAGWVIASPTNGVLSPGGTTNVTVALTALAASLPPGTNTDTLVFSNLTGTASLTRPMMLTVLPRVLDHFALSAIASPQLVGTPFAVTITAQDYEDLTVTNFNGSVTLSGKIGSGLTTNNILGSPVHTTFGTGDYTFGYAFTPNTNLTVTHVRHYFGSKVSIWTDGGTLLASRNLGFSNAPGTWMETPLAAPVQLTAGVRYRVASYTSGFSYWHTALGTNFPNGTIDQSYQIAGDAFPTIADSARWPFVDLRYIAEEVAAVPIAPTVSSPFTNGVWTGDITVLQPALDMYLLAAAGSGVGGTSAAFSVMLSPPVITSQYDAGSGTLEIAWSGTGFRLQAQTNNLDVGITTNWFDYPGGTTSPVTVPIDPANPSVFYRLVWP